MDHFCVAKMWVNVKSEHGWDFFGKGNQPNLVPATLWAGETTFTTKIIWTCAYRKPKRKSTMKSVKNVQTKVRNLALSCRFPHNLCIIKKCLFLVTSF